MTVKVETVEISDGRKLYLYTFEEQSQEAKEEGDA